MQADRVFTFTQGGQWRQAFEPMHSHDATYGGSLYAALNSSPTLAGPGLFFAQKLADLLPSVNVAMVPVGVGGTKMADHAPSTSVFAAGQALTSQAASFGQVKATLFIQGESDTLTSSDANGWGARFADYVAGLRALYGDDHIVIFAQLGADPGAAYLYWNTVKAQQAAVNISGVFMVTTGDLEKQGDGLHYTTAACQQLGERMAVKYREVLSSLPSETF